MLFAGEKLDRRVEITVRIEQRKKLPVLRKVGRTQLDRPGTGTVYYLHAGASDVLDPAGELFGTANRGGKKQDPDPRRSENDRFFPHVAAILVGKIMGLVDDHKIGLHLLALAQCVE